VTRPNIDGILLAAGESRRMGYPKPLLKIDNETFLSRALARMLEVARNVIVVTGAHEERVRAAIPVSRRVRIAHNREFKRGQLSSLKCAIVALAEDADAALVHLADHPMVEATTFRVAADRFREGGGAIMIARHQGRRGHPVIFAREIFGELLAAPEDQGARFVVNADPTRVCYVDVADPGVTIDLDTPEDLVRAGLRPPPSGDVA
jgi:molybdenum cofactor cytidylyltransferase